MLCISKVHIHWAAENCSVPKLFKGTKAALSAAGFGLSLKNNEAVNPGLEFLKDTIDMRQSVEGGVLTTWWKSWRHERHYLKMLLELTCTKRLVHRRHVTSALEKKAELWHFTSLVLLSQECILVLTPSDIFNMLYGSKHQANENKHKQRLKGRLEVRKSFITKKGKRKKGRLSEMSWLEAVWHAKTADAPISWYMEAFKPQSLRLGERASTIKLPPENGMLLT